ncbi:hypothetical protein D3C75_530720 [compost metagenome]
MTLSAVFVIVPVYSVSAEFASVSKSGYTGLYPGDSQSVSLKMEGGNLMDRLAWEAVSTFVLLIIAYMSLYFSFRKRTPFARYSALVLLVASGAPLVVMLVLENAREAKDANIGLGMAFLLTWVITALIFLLSLVLWILRLRKKRYRT